MVKHNSGQILTTVVRYWSHEDTTRQKEERGDAFEELSRDDGSNIVVKYKKNSGQILAAKNSGTPPSLSRLRLFPAASAESRPPQQYHPATHHPAPEHHMP